MSGIGIWNRLEFAIGRLVLAMVLAFHATTLLGQDDSSNNSTSDDFVVAKVGEYRVRQQAIENEIPVADWQKGLTDSQIEKVKSTALQRIIDRYIVFDYLQKNGQPLGRGEIQVKKEALLAELATVEKTLVDYLKEQRVTEAELEFRFAWQVAWKRYLKDKLTESNLELHFNNNRRKFDGTKLRVAHLLLKASSASDFAAALKSAGEIKKQIDGETLTWEKAVTEYSQGSQKNAGEIGVIERVGAMPPSFSAAAFLLQQGQVSPPVTTGVGVHLVKCLEVIPGTRGWRDARKAVEKDAELFLFDVIVKRHRENVKVEEFETPR